MRKVVLFIATSLDGYIARSTGAVDWLFTDQDYSYTPFFSNVSTVLMGRKTYEQILTFEHYPYQGVEGFVFSRSRAHQRDQNVTFIAPDLPTFIAHLQKEVTGKDLWLVGGADLIQAFLIYNLIDEFVISIHPIILGEGIPLFKAPLPRQNLTLKRTQSFETGLLQVTYSRL